MSELGITPGSGLIYYSGYASQQPISASNTQVITVPMQLSFVNGLSLQVKSDGGAAVNYAFQVSNVPLSLTFPEGNASPGIARDESFGSADWNTVLAGSGTLAAGSPTSDILVLDRGLFAYGRITLQYSAGGAAKVAVLMHGVGY